MAALAELSPLAKWWAMATAAPVLACDCGNQYLDSKNGKERAVQVFSGTPIAKTGHFGDMTYVFQIDSLWHGMLLKNTTVNGGMGSCAFAFRIGVPYLIFSSGGKGSPAEPVKTSICSANKELANSFNEVKDLGRVVYSYSQPQAIPSPAKKLVVLRPPGR